MKIEIVAITLETNLSVKKTPGLFVARIEGILEEKGRIDLQPGDVVSLIQEARRINLTKVGGE